MTPGVMYVFLFFAYALEGTSLPVPAELVSLASGRYLASGELSFWGSVAAATLGNIAGGMLAYAVGYRAGDRLRRGTGLARVLGITRRGLERAEAWFHRYGGLSTLGARWVGFIRPATLLGAGALRLSLPVYVVYGTIGSLTYCLFWQYVAWKFAPLATRLISGRLVEGTLALVASLGGGLVVLRWLGREDA